MNAKIQLEIQRVISVLDELVEDLQILQYIPRNQKPVQPQVAKKMSEVANRAVQELYDEEGILLSKLDERKQSDVVEWSLRVKKATMKVCQLLKEEKFVGQIPMDELDTKKMLQFVHMMEDLRTVWIGKLTMTEEERQIQNELKKETAAREKKANADKKALERELASEKSSREKELSIREDFVKKYQADYAVLLQETSAERSTYDKTMEDKEKLAKQKYEKFRSLITERIKKTKQLLSEMKQLNMDSENELKLRRKNAEKQVEDTVNEYDSYMSKTTLRVNTLMKEHKEDNVRLEFLNKELQKCDQDRREKESEYEAIVALEQKKQEARRKRMEAAATISRFYRRVLDRRAEQKRLEKLAKKKKKKGAKSPAKSPSKK